MMSEAQLPATSSQDDADEHHSSKIASEAFSKKTRNSDSIRSNGDQNNNEHVPYPTMTSTEAVAGNDTASPAAAPNNNDSPTAQVHSQHHESLPQTPTENQFIANSTCNAHKNEVNARHLNHTNAIRDDSLSSKNLKVDNINTAMSAPMSVLGANSDRSDFFRGSNNNSSSANNSPYNSNNDQGMPTPNNTALGKVKSWFAGGDKEESSDTTAHDYREFSSPSGTNKRRNEITTNNDEYIEGDVELAANNNHGSREEEEVMEKCSFAYGPDSPQNYKSSHTIPSIDQQYSNEGSPTNNGENDDIDDMEDEENQEYFGRNYQNRRINPKAIAHHITSRAKRTWTERRYRRRLRQSQFIPPNNTTAETDDMNGHSSISPTSAAVPSSFHYELTSEHRYAFAAAHAALNGKLANEQYRNRHANLREDGFTNDDDLRLDIEQSNNGEEEVRADLTKSSLAIRGGLIRLPVDNVRLVCDEHLQPGILSIETRDMGGSSGGGTKGYEMFGNANRYGNIHGNMMMHHGIGDGSSTDQRQQSEKIAEVWERHELAYVLTVDQHIYQRVAQEMGDANRVPFGIYFCCHETGGGENHVGIEVAVLILLIIFFLLVAGMIAWPTW